MICIDPGHGMSNRRRGLYDPGAVWTEDGQRFEEATIVLQYGLALRDALRAKGHEVFMTRDDAEDHAPVGERAGNAARLGAKLFVSLHLNSADSDLAHGVETLFDDEAGRPLAKALNDAVVAASGLKDRGIKQRGDLAVLAFKGPAALVELGFLPNDGDRETLLNPAVRHRVVAAMAEVLDAFAQR